MSVETNVSERYAQGALERQEALCCPVDYDASLLRLLPQEIIEKDYGCGDPSRYVRDGDVVLDLGSGGGKICYMAAQLVGDGGRVIGVDMTDEMLNLARKYQPEMAIKLGSDLVTFKKGHIQDLAISLDAVEAKVTSSPITSIEQLSELEHWKNQVRQHDPMIADNEVSLVISNCVLNLVDKNQRHHMISEIFRVLKPGGRVAISDIVSDEHVPQSLQNDPTLWSGCISGAFQEQEFLQAFIDAGFVAVAYDKWDDQPWQTVEGIEFRSATLVATKPSGDQLYDAGQAVIYKGPYSEVTDDFGNEYPRGARIAVSRCTFELLKDGPYGNDFIGIEPAEQCNLGCFCKSPATLRPVSETKGGQHSGTGSSTACC
jgi:arsenite methyltransferase